MSADFEAEQDAFHQMVDHLACAAQWERLLKITKERLGGRPDDDTAHRGAALALLRMRRPDEASLHVDYVLRGDAGHSFHHELAAQVAMQQRRFRAAEDHLVQALAIDPEKVNLHRLMTHVKSVLGQLASAHQHAQRVFELEGGSIGAWLSQEAALEGAGFNGQSLEERIRALEEALKEGPENAYLLWRVGRLLLQLEQPAAALVWLSRALAGDPLSPRLKADWRRASENRFLVYQALLFPWRAWQKVAAFWGVARLRPDLWASMFWVVLGWLLLLPCWLLSWVCLAPWAVVARYFLMPHPAFDIPGFSRRWLAKFSLKRRAVLMVGMTLAVLLGLGLVLPWRYLLAWLGLGLVEGFLVLYCLDAAMQQRRSESPTLPVNWLRSE